MAKFNNTQWIWVAALIIAVVVVIIMIVNLLKGTPELQATISDSVIDKGELIEFQDNTNMSTQWLWEFGNGDSSVERSGTYNYKQSGRYQIRLTVNNKYYKIFTVDIKNPIDLDSNPLTSISAPYSAFQDEFIVLNGVGDDKQWRWEFGETGIVDSREKNPIYSYTTPGVYYVQLTTENTRYPIRHKIEILPRYTDGDSTDVATLMGNDIREKLQNIVDGQSFNTNYNYILREYLDHSSTLEVVINNNKRNDFYSYCQGLRHIGRNCTIIETVFIETDDPQSKVITKLQVIQLDQ